METPDFNKIQNITIYIPYIHANITEHEIYCLFRIHEIGDIKKIKLFGINTRFNSAVIYFNHWFLNTDNFYIQKYINHTDVQDVRILYNANVTNAFWTLKKYIEPDLQSIRLNNGGPMLGDGILLQNKRRINIL